MESRPVYFKGLTELRAIAALMVIIHHVELYKYRQSYPSLYDGWLRDIIAEMGKNGVYIFFVLSGFLITFLLLKENEKAGTISIRRFYYRRILRIWPLYYLVLAIAFFVVPFSLGVTFFAKELYYQEAISKLQYGWNLVLHLLFLSNFALKIFSPVVGAAQSWSVSVEEQFYLFWPILLKNFVKSLPLVLLIIAIGKPIFVSIIVHIMGFFDFSSEILDAIMATIRDIKFEYMALGGILAYFLFKRADVFEKVFRSKVVIFSILLILLGAILISVNSYILAILFTGMIGVIVASGIQNSWLRRFGEVSYGAYMFHPMIIYLTFAFLNNYCSQANAPYAYHLLAYILVLALTYFMSVLSFKYIESFFMKIKRKYAVVKSNA